MENSKMLTLRRRAGVFFLAVALLFTLFAVYMLIFARTDQK